MITIVSSFQINAQLRGESLGITQYKNAFH